MITEDDIKDLTVEELFDKQCRLKELLRLYKDHLDSLNDLGRTGQWLSIGVADMAEFNRDLELVSQELAQRRVK